MVPIQIRDHGLLLLALPGAAILVGVGERLLYRF